MKSFTEISGVFRKKYASNILFWICFFFILRLFNITAAPIEMAHNWRQAFTNTVARNFLEIDNNIFYPRALIFGNNPGIVGTEFPLLNYLIYLVSEVFGYAHWYGRLINLIVTSIGIYYFYKIIFKFLKPSLAFNSALILICSLWFVFARKSMPDTFSISIVFIGLYYGLNFLSEKKYKDLLFYILFTATGILCKIPGIFFLAIFAVPLFDKMIEKSTKLLFIAASGIILVPVFYWYFKWVPYLDSLYNNRLYFPRTLSEGMKEVFANIVLTSEKFYFSSFQSYIAFLFFIAGLFFVLKNKNKKIIIIFALLTFIFILFIFKTGIVFPLHSYYVIPYVPVMCLLAAYAVEQIKSTKFRTLLLIVIIGEAIANQQDDFFTKRSQMYKLDLEAIADKLSDKKDLIAINGGESPQLIYFAHRNGWRLSNEEAGNYEFLKSLKMEGCKYLFLDKHVMQDFKADLKLEEIYKDENFIVYKL